MVAHLSRGGTAALVGTAFVLLYVGILLVLMLVVFKTPTVIITAPSVPYAGKGATGPVYRPTCDIVCNSTLTKTAVQNRNGWEDAVGAHVKPGTPLDAATCTCEPSKELPWNSVLGNVTLPGNNGTKLCDQYCNESQYMSPARQLLQSMGYSGSMVHQPGTSLEATGADGDCACQLTNMPRNFASLP